MATEFDPYSAPTPPSWVDEEGGQRLGVRNDSLRGPLAIPRAERVLEILCGRSPIGVVYPRGRRHEWRLDLLGRDKPLSAGETDHLAVAFGAPEDEPSRRFPFKCVCGRMHVLDLDAVIATSELLEPPRRRMKARAIDFRRVARVIGAAEP